MKNSDLRKRVSALGFALFGTEEGQNANLTLAEMVKSSDLRFWEGFPVVLANSAEQGLFNYKKVAGYLKHPSDKACLSSLTAMSLALYKFFNLKFSWAEELFESLSKERKKECAELFEELKVDKEFTVSGRQMSAQRLKTVFSNYFTQSRAKLNDLLLVKDELSLEYALAQVFSPKQKELFLKRLRREKFTKTEKEYFSRVVKKKVLAVANPELHRLSQRLLE